MSKQKEIDEMIDIIVEELDNSYAFGLEVAGEKIYHIYRRKRKDACEKTAKKVRKETAKKILQWLYNLCKGGFSLNASEVRRIAKTHGIEVDE